MLRSPKEKFAISAFKKPFEQMVMTQAFEEATHAALLELAMEMPDAPSAQCMDPHSQMVGARKVLEILSKLHVKEEANQQPRTPRLNEAAGV